MPRNQSLDGLRVVVDCANGAAYKVAPEALWELGAEVISIGVEPDGFNINKECGSTAPALLSQKVREVRADIGIALDGDADRVLIVDERGHVIDGDQLLAVIAENWIEDGRLAKSTVVATVMSNLSFERHLATLGLKLERTAGRRSSRMFATRRASRSRMRTCCPPSPTRNSASTAKAAS
jgi:phosphoglucosamine mutase